MKKARILKSIVALCLTFAVLFGCIISVSAKSSIEQHNQLPATPISEVQEHKPSVVTNNNGEAAVEPTLYSAVQEEPEQSETILSTEFVDNQQIDVEIQSNESMEVFEPVDISSKIDDETVFHTETVINEEVIRAQNSPEQNKTTEITALDEDEKVAHNENENPKINASVYSYSELTIDKLPSKLLTSVGLSEFSQKNAHISLSTDDAEQLNSFTTVNADGTNTLYLFSNPIKYIDEKTNEIRFIDNNIVPTLGNSDSSITNDALMQNEKTAQTLTGYANSSNTFNINMPLDVNNGISLEKDNFKITLRPAITATSVAEIKTVMFRGIEEQVVEYANGLGKGIHLQYIPINNGVKENIVLDRYPDTNKFNFILDAGDYYPLYNEGEAIPFIDPLNKEIAFILGQIDARDSYTGEETDGHFTIYNSLSLSELGAGKYTLTVTVEQQFLTSANTVYPVIIDPSITIGSSYMQDTSVYSLKPTSQTFYSSAYNIVGDHGSSYGVGTAFIQTSNLSSYSYILPGNITSATYRVYEGSGKTGSVQIQASRVLSSWNQTSITYNNMPRPDYISHLTITSSGWKNFDLTNLIKKMLAPTSGSDYLPETFGFALKSVDESVSSRHFCSANHSSNPPSIIINYNTSYVTLDVDAVYDPYNDTSFKAMGYLIHGNSPEFKLNITTAGTYNFETTNSFAYFGNHSQDTKILLFNSNHIQIAMNDDISSTNLYSKISTYLSSGTYYVRVLDISGTMANIQCYLVVELDGELSQTPEFYANHTRDFYKVADATASYNCFAYVLGERTWIGLSTDFNGATTQLIEKGATIENVPTDNCIIMYGYGNRYIRHVAIVEDGVVKAKMSEYERVRHSSIDAYFNFTSTTYTDSCGYPLRFFTHAS